MKGSKENNFSHIPNGITTIRLLLAIAFPFIPETWHLTVVAIALVTEFLDGFISRLFGWTSYFGQVFDPVADKLFFISVGLTWVWLEKLTIVQLLLLGSRDFGVLLIALAVALSGRGRNVKPIKAQLLSKVTTGMQYLVLLAILFDVSRPVSALVIITAVLGVLATGQYIFMLRHAYKSSS